MGVVLAILIHGSGHKFISWPRISPLKSCDEETSIKQERYCLSRTASIKASLRELLFLPGIALPSLPLARDK
jgi:hypothetical protein